MKRISLLSVWLLVIFLASCRAPWRAPRTCARASSGLPGAYPRTKPRWTACSAPATGTTCAMRTSIPPPCSRQRPSSSSWKAAMTMRTGWRASSSATARRWKHGSTPAARCSSTPRRTWETGCSTDSKSQLVRNALGCDAGRAVDPGHPIFNGPFTPVGTVFEGSAFCDGTVRASGAERVIENAVGRVALGALRSGAGIVLFGSMTTDNFHTPQPEASNLRANLIAFTAGGGALSLSPFVAMNDAAAVDHFVLRSASR